MHVILPVLGLGARHEATRLHPDLGPTFLLVHEVVLALLSLDNEGAVPVLGLEHLAFAVVWLEVLDTLRLGRRWAIVGVVVLNVNLPVDNTLLGCWGYGCWGGNG